MRCFLWIHHWESTMEPSVFGLYRHWDINGDSPTMGYFMIQNIYKERNHRIDNERLLWQLWNESSRESGYTSFHNPQMEDDVLMWITLLCSDDPTKLSSGWSPIELYNHDLTQVTWNDMIILGCIKCSWVDSSQSQTLGNAVSTTFWDEITCETLMPLMTHYTHCTNAALNFTSHNPT